MSNDDFDFSWEGETQQNTSEEWGSVLVEENTVHQSQNSQPISNSVRRHSQSRPNPVQNNTAKVQSNSVKPQNNSTQVPSNSTQMRRRPRVPLQEEQPVAEQPVTPQPPKKKPLWLFIVIGVLILGVLAVVGIKVYNTYFVEEPLVAQAIDYSVSGQVVYKNFESLLHNFDAKSVDDFVGDSNGDSYLAQEWAYVNKVKCRENFIRQMTSYVSFEFPLTPQLSTTGVEMTDDNGNVIMIESPMNNGENVIIVYPDYSKLIDKMEEDRDYINKLFKASGYKDTDYTWYDDMTNLFIQYISELDEIPLTKSEFSLPISNGKIVDDSLLDDLLFGNKDFHSVIAKFSQCCLGYTGFVEEIYYVEEEQHNPEYDEWFEIFLGYFIADGGSYNEETGELTGYQNFVKGVSKWEPWYVYDDNGKIQKNEDGTLKVKYFSVKREDGTDWIQPSETITVEVEHTRQVEVEWVEETGILYNFIGTHFLATKYDGVGSTVTRFGDGSVKYPAGVGTSIITKVLCSDGKYHDIRITLKGYWTGKDAIDYVERFSPKNRGFSETSLTKLITYEFEIENLENTTITFDSEMSLSDKNSNIATRTGVMYGLTSSATLKPYEKIILNDWNASTELEQKYVVWGKSFKRDYPMVYFNVLAGTGVIPTYSAYKQFTGTSDIQ